MWNFKIHQNATILIGYYNTLTVKHQQVNTFFMEHKMFNYFFSFSSINAGQTIELRQVQVRTINGCGYCLLSIVKL